MRSSDVNRLRSTATMSHIWDLKRRNKDSRYISQHVVQKTNLKGQVSKLGLVKKKTFLSFFFHFTEDVMTLKVTQTESNSHNCHSLVTATVPICLLTLVPTLPASMLCIVCPGAEIVHKRLLACKHFVLLRAAICRALKRGFCRGHSMWQQCYSWQAIPTPHLRLLNSL